MSKLESSTSIYGFHSSINLSLDEKEGIGSNDISSMNEESVQSTPDIEKKYVHHVYDAIAPHFSSTRFAKWPKVAGFLNSLSPGSIVLDAGCGNGKYLGLNPECFFIGCDISPSLIDICSKKGQEVLVADAVNLPYRSNFGDAAISIAVLHHLSTEKRRRKAVEELVRVVRKDGLVLITVWAAEQEDGSLVKKWTPLFNKYDDPWVRPSGPRERNSSEVALERISESDDNCTTYASQSEEPQFDENMGEPKMIVRTPAEDLVGVSVSSANAQTETQQEYFVPWHLPYHRAEIGGAFSNALANGLAKKDDRKGAMVYNRYYHVFVQGELERLVSGISNTTIVDKFYDKSNWCIILQKV